MMDCLAHRGPDDEGTYRAGRSEGRLGHRRLSIMDPRGGRQPILAADENRAIVANGEFYNFPSLREQLAETYHFQTRSDTESAIHLYDDVATAAAARLDGMFALAIADSDALYLARDPVGIKPLYYGRRNGDFVFASELKALAGRAEDVREFPAGSWYHSALGFRRFYKIPEVPLRSDSVDGHAARIRKALQRAVENRLMSDVPLGAFLSGGLDSSLIAAMVRPQVDELHTFSVGFEGSGDLEAARIVSRHLDTIHHEYVITVDEIIDELPHILYWLESFDQDLVRSAIPCHFTSRLAADEVKVILTGEGADELFAGYDYYKGIRDNQALHRELRRSVGALHNVNLQRVDRLTMAHSIEGRVPFLDVSLIKTALQVPPDLKLYRDSRGRRIEKWILRKACEDLLPREIVWRDKEQFDEGSGTVDAIAEAVGHWMRPDEARRYKQAHPEAELRSREECVYHKLLTGAYDDPSVVLANVARWSDRPAAA